MGNISKPVLVSNSGFAIFFDNVRVDQFVKDYSTSMGVDASIGTATINMVYVPDFDKIIHNYNTSNISSVSDQASKPSTTTTTTTTKVQKAEVVNCWHLTIRQGPGMNTPAIAWVDAGDILPVHGRGGNNNYWVKVTSTNGKTGWTGSKYLRIYEETQTVTSSGSSSGSSSIVVGSKVKVHGTRYATGQAIPSWVKKRTHTVMQVGTGKVLLKEIYSWVYTSDVTLEGTVATASTKTGDSTIQDGVTATLDDGIEYMTNVRIFVKNIFNGKYVQIFGGNITSKSTTYTGAEKTLSFQCQDFMNWLTRTICPIAVPYDGTLQIADRLKWKAQGIDLDKVRSVNSIKDITFKGKTLSQTWQIISKQTISANKIYSSSDTVSAWDNALNRVVVMGDIDENLRKAEVVDFMITTSTTQINSTYVMMNDILRTLMFEFYQDRDETIRIKPPFWNEHVLRNHVIDPSLILSFTESTNYNQMYTRVIATGGLEEWHKTEGLDDFTTSLLTPVVVYTSSGITANSGPVVVTSSTTNSVGGGTGSNIATAAVAVAKQYVGWKYIWGASDPSQGGFDCSGLVYYAYKQAGYTGWTGRETTYTLLNKGRRVASANDLKPGDLLFPHAGHVYMYIGNNQVIHAPRTGDVVKIVSLSASQYAHDKRRYVEWDGTGNTSSTEYVKPESIGPDSLLQPTYIEKKYGPLIYDAAQPLIKFSTSTSTDSTSAYDALSKYARFMLNYLNSSVTMSSMQTIAMPWLRPGFNVWVDPVRTDKIFYINNISHYGNASGNFTTLNMTMGRRRTDFINKKSMVGALNPGQSDDIFVNKLKVTPENFGTVCNYNEVVNKVNAFYNDSSSSVKECRPTDDYFKYLYGSDSGGSKYSETSSSSTAKTTTSTPSIVVGSTVKLHGARYATGETIPNWVKERTHTVMQVGNGKILLREIYSWVYTSDVTLVSGGGTSSGGSSSTGTVYNTGGVGLYVRSGPGKNYSIIGSLWDGNTVNIIKSQNGWHNINHNGSSNAWVSANYIKTTTASSAATQSADPSSKYASHSSSSVIPSEASISEIQNILNNKYAGAPTVVKDRKNRLASIINASNPYLKNLYAGNYPNNPININSGSTS